MTVYFYSTKGVYGPLSNFSRHTVTYQDLVWPTSEHLFQALKFTDPVIRKRIRLLPAPGAAAREGRDRRNPLRDGWDEVCTNWPPDLDWAGPELKLKDYAMARVIELKFTQHPELRELLLSTGDAGIVEASPVDAYWGWGPDKTGLNMLGKLLVALREHLRRTP